MVLDFALIGTYITSANWNYFYISQLPLTMARTILHPPKIDKKQLFYIPRSVTSHDSQCDNYFSQWWLEFEFDLTVYKYIQRVLSYLQKLTKSLNQNLFYSNYLYICVSSSTLSENGVAYNLKLSKSNSNSDHHCDSCSTELSYIHQKMRIKPSVQTKY